MPITDSEKARRRALLKTHYDVENDHDMNGIMETFLGMQSTDPLYALRRDAYVGLAVTRYF